MTKTILAPVVAVCLLAGAVRAQSILRYDMNEGAGATAVNNTATAPVGTSPAPLLGGVSLVDGVGCGGSSAFGGAGNGSGPGDNTIDTGWAATTTGSWYLSFALDLSAATATDPFQYCTGDVAAGNWRTFTNGAAGVGNILMRGALNEAPITGGGAQAGRMHVLWVYDDSVPEIRGYLDGVLVDVTPQGAQIVHASTATASPFFTVGGYSGSAVSCRPGVYIDDFELGLGVPTQLQINGLVAGCVPGEYQTNQPGSSSLDIEGLQGGLLTPAVFEACIDVPGAINSDGIAGLPWDLAVGVLPAVPATSGAFITGGGQIVNQDLTDPVLTFLHGLGFTSPYPGPFMLAYNFPAGPITVAAQQVNADPAHPSGEGIALSQHNQLDVVLGSTFDGPLLDDGFLQILGATCGGPATGMFLFDGISHADAYVNSNGSITFGAGDGDFSATPAEFAIGAPRIAGMWTDLSPNVGGSVTTTLLGGTLTCDFAGVPAFGGASANSVRMTVTAAGLATIDAYVPDLTHTTDTLIGFSPGTSATDPGPVGGVAGGTILGAMGTGPFTNLATDMIYEYVFAGAPTGGWSQFTWSGSTSWDVN